MTKIKVAKRNKHSKPRVVNTNVPGRDDGNLRYTVDGHLNIEPFPASGPRRITNKTANNILFFYFDNLMPKDQSQNSTYSYRTTIADTAYLTLSPAWVRNAILADPILSPDSYLNDVFDCDDYVQYLKVRMGLYAANHNLTTPLGLGYLLTRKHAFSFCIDHDRTVWLINTQSETKPMTNDTEIFSQFLKLSSSNIITTLYL